MANLWADFLALVFPRVCLTCDNHLVEEEDQICLSCLLELIDTDCGNHQASLKNKYGVEVQFDKVYGFLQYQKKGKVQKVLQNLKYSGDQRIGYALGKIYARKMVLEDNFDAIVPVPLHERKLRSRGYNQSERWAAGLSEGLSIPVAQLLSRSIHTETQTKKSRLDRWVNVEHVFELSSELPSHNHVLLVDDVVTTGATLEACAKKLLEGGVKKVSVCVLAIAQ